MRSRLHAQHYIPRLAESHLNEHPLSGRLSGGPTDEWGVPHRDRGLSRGPGGAAPAKGRDSP